MKICSCNDCENEELKAKLKIAEEALNETTKVLEDVKEALLKLRGEK